MTNKLILVGLAIAAVGLIALPQTLALFAGQHDWYTVLDVTDPLTFDANAAQNFGIPCQKCHSDVYTEKAGSGPHKTSTTCADCHIVALYDKGATVGGTGQIHAAALPACMDCHDGSWSGAPAAYSIINGSEEAHRPFASGAGNSSLLKGANEACIACHTHVAVDINWQKAYKIGFNAVEEASTGAHVWTVSNFIAEGTAKVSTYGNRSGQIVGQTAWDIAISPAPPGYDAANP